MKAINIKLRGRGKAYRFDPCNLELDTGDPVLVETVQGMTIGVVSEPPYEYEPSSDDELRPVLRLATVADLAHFEENKELEKEAFDIALERIKALELDMHLVDVEYMFDNRKIIFYFTADGRIDFRELVKELAAIFRTRIELRQIGVRDEARMIGGISICGRELCCSSFLKEFVPVSIKMAKAQNLSMNPSKISGACGRLLCCLQYEHHAYVEANKRVPRKGAAVLTPHGEGRVLANDLLREMVTVQLYDDDDANIETWHVDDVKVINESKAKSKRSRD